MKITIKIFIINHKHDSWKEINFLYKLLIAINKKEQKLSQILLLIEISNSMTKSIRINKILIKNNKYKK